jgi:hypothetical protein
MVDTPQIGLILDRQVNDVGACVLGFFFFPIGRQLFAVNERRLKKLLKFVEICWRFLRQRLRRG